MNKYDEDKIKYFNKKYSDKYQRNRLQKIADRNDYLVNRFILGEQKNPFYTPNDISPITKKDNEYYALIDWIIPNTKYKYKEISIKDYLKSENVYRSSIIPVVKIDGENHWLLGNFYDYENSGDPILADFGGRCENGETPFECALREAKEESKKLLYDLLKNVSNKDYIAIYEGYNKNKVIFTFIQIDLNDAEDIIEKFKNIPWIPGQERFGDLKLYNQKDVRLYRTSKNLTDLLSYLN